MSVEIQEPNDLPPNSITDENADRYEILVYEKSPDVAGIKRLAIAGWKDYMAFNTHKVNNVASYLGMPTDYAWDSDHDIPYPDPANHKFALSDQVKNLSDKLGISTEPQTPFNPVYPRLQALETDVNATNTGLKDRMTKAETDISSLADEIGSSTGTGTTLTERISALETTVDTPNTGLRDRVTSIENVIGTDSTAGTIKNNIVLLRDDVNALQTTVNDPNNGLVKKVGDNTTDITSLQTVVGDSAGGLVKNVTDNTTAISNINTVVGDSTSGLVKDVETLQTVVGDSTSGLVKDVETLQTVVGDSAGGLVKDVDDNATDISNINGILGDGTTDGLRKTVNDLNTTVNDPNDGLVKRVDNLESEVFRFSGSITAVDNPDDTTAITVNGSSISLSALKNGQVFDINPAGVVPDAKIKMTINGVSKEYSRGQNVVWVEPESGLPYFDELAANIDVEEVNKIAARYGSRSIAANTSYDISDWHLPSGVYQFTLCATSGLLRNVSIVIVPILDSSVAIVDETGIVKITPDNFATYWEFTAGSLFVKSSAGLKSLTFTKIGEL